MFGKAYIMNQPKVNLANSVIQLKKNMMYIIVAVLVVVIIVAGAAAYILSTGNNGTNPSPTPTPAPTVSVADATTLTFSANVTSSGATTTYEWKGTNIHSAPTIRADLPGYTYVLNSTAEKSWSSTDNGATWTAGTFNTDWPFWGNQWSVYVDELTPGHWDGTSSTYSFTNAQGEAIVLFNIVVNPTIPDSTFATS
jgi:hypothetical protein